MISVLIIDDEQDSIDDLLYLFKKHELQVNVVATATSGQEGLVAILKYKPQLVFLDVMMPGMSGFEMLELVPNIDFQIIITTSVDKYAIQAIRASALDFLLKPVNSKELKNAIDRCVEKHEAPSKTQITLLSDSLKERSKPLSKIALTIADGVQLVNLHDILYFESDGNYTTVFMHGDKSVLISKPIARFEEMVQSSVFFRIHNSYLVNLLHVSKFIRGEGGYVVLANGKTIPVARSRKDAFLEVLGKI